MHKFLNIFLVATISCSALTTMLTATGGNEEKGTITPPVKPPSFEIGEEELQNAGTLKVFPSEMQNSKLKCNSVEEV